MELDNKIKNEISLTMVMFLTFSGGLMDAYSYINRVKVFSNAGFRIYFWNIFSGIF